MLDQWTIKPQYILLESFKRPQLKVEFEGNEASSRYDATCLHCLIEAPLWLPNTRKATFNLTP